MQLQSLRKLQSNRLLLPRLLRLNFQPSRHIEKPPVRRRQSLLLLLALPVLLLVTVPLLALPVLLLPVMVL